MSTQQQPQEPVDLPVPTPFADAASPFTKTEVPVIPGPPAQPLLPPAPQQSTWILYRAQINFGLASLAYLMVLVGSMTVVSANPNAQWRYYVAAFPLVPAAVVLIIFMRAVVRLSEVHVRIQMEAFGLSVGATGLITFGYGFLEGAGLPQLPWVYVLPLMAIFWSLGVAFFSWRRR